MFIIVSIRLVCCNIKQYHRVRLVIFVFLVQLQKKRHSSSFSHIGTSRCSYLLKWQQYCIRFAFSLNVHDPSQNNGQCFDSDSSSIIRGSVLMALYNKHTCIYLHSQNPSSSSSIHNLLQPRNNVPTHNPSIRRRKDITIHTIHNPTMLWN